MRFRKDFDPIVLNMCYDGHAERSCAPLKTNEYLRRTGVLVLKNFQFIFESLKRRIYVDKGQLISKGLPKGLAVSIFHGENRLFGPPKTAS